MDGGLDRQLRAMALSPFVGQRLGAWFVASENSADLDELRRLIEAGAVTPVVSSVIQLAERFPTRCGSSRPDVSRARSSSPPNAKALPERGFSCPPRAALGGHPQSATSYFAAPVRCPGESPAGIALRALVALAVAASSDSKKRSTIDFLGVHSAPARPSGSRVVRGRRAGESGSYRCELQNVHGRYRER